MHSVSIPKQVLEVALGLIGASYFHECEPLKGGRTNKVWRLLTDEGNFAVKLFIPNDNPLFPNSPQDEVRALTALGPASIAPRFVGAATSDLGDLVIYQFVGSANGAVEVVDCADLMRRLHHFSPYAGLRNGTNGSNTIFTQTRAILALCHGKLVEQINARMPANTVPPTKNMALIHTDFTVANVVGAGSGAVLIDWQCPANGDPCEDIAMFLSPAMRLRYGGESLTCHQVDQFWNTYDSTQTRERYQEIGPWYHWRMAAYCLWRMQHRGEDDRAILAELVKIS